MRISREFHLIIGLVAGVISGALSWGRFLQEKQHGLSVVAVAIIFGIVVGSMVVVVALEPYERGGPETSRLEKLGNAGAVWLGLLLAAVVIAEGIDRSFLAEPALKLLVATLAGISLGCYWGPRLSLGAGSRLNGQSGRNRHAGR